MEHRARVLAFFAFGLLALCATAASAGIHTWNVNEVFSNADGTIQFVELQEGGGGNFETGVANGSITSNAKSFSWSGPAVTNTGFKYYLIATPGFAALPGAPTPDAIVSPGTNIPFFSTSGDSVSFVVYDTCTFGAIPTDGVHSHNCVSHTSVVNSPTNYAGGTGSVTAAITLNHVDNYQDGSVMLWSGGSSPTNVGTGGPAGAADKYLQISAASSLLETFNKIQFAGNYAAAGVNQIQMNLNNFGGDPLNVRIMLLTPGCDGGGSACTAWTSTTATPLASGSGWTTATFSIAEANLTRVLGSDSYAASLPNIERLVIRHDDGAASDPNTGSPVSSTLGIDNVVPEPPGPLALAAGALLLAALGRKRRQTPA